MKRECAPGCDCRTCMILVHAAIAKNPDGTPFFTEAEVYTLAETFKEQPCPPIE